MRLARRGVGWDRASRARVYSIVGRVMALLGMGGIVINLDPYVMLPPPLSVLLPFVLFLGIAAMFIGLIVATEARNERMGDVEIDATGALHLHAGKESRIFARGDLRGAWLVWSFDGRRVDHWVEIVARNGTSGSIHVLSVDEGRALIAALGFETGGRAVHIPLAKRARRRFHLLFAFLAYVAAGT